MKQINSGSARTSSKGANSTSNNRLGQLSKLLANSETVLPVYVRFQTAAKYFTVPVMAVAVNSESVQVTVADGSTITVQLDSLLDVVAFHDAAGKPVFLHDFSKDEQVVLESCDEEEASCETSMDDDSVKTPIIAEFKRIWTRRIPMYKPIKINVRRRTEKVYSLVVTLKFPKRSAA